MFLSQTDKPAFPGVVVGLDKGGRLLGLGALFILLAGTFRIGAARGEELPTLEKALQQQAPKILKFALDRGHLRAEPNLFK